jgi:hypothetical protein
MKTERIQQKVDSICGGDFCDADVGLLFVWLRPHLKKDPVLWDLANFVAHNDERNQGISFNHVQGFVRNFLEVSEKGGTIYGLQPLFQRDNVIERLTHVLNRLGITFTETDLLLQKDRIVDSLMSLMEDTEFLIRDKRVIKCHTKRQGGAVMFSLQANLKTPNIEMSEGASVESTLFN